MKAQTEVLNFFWKHLESRGESGIGEQQTVFLELSG